jgi:hypothetical protein
MKKNNFLFGLLLLVILSIVSSCKEKTNGNTTPPPNEEKKTVTPLSEEKKEKSGDVAYKEVIAIRDLLKDMALIPPFVASTISESKKFKINSTKTERDLNIYSITSNETKLNYELTLRNNYSLMPKIAGDKYLCKDYINISVFEPNELTTDESEYFSKSIRRLSFLDPTRQFTAPTKMSDGSIKLTILSQDCSN